MRDWCLDLFDPRTTIMDSVNSSSTGDGDPDFDFAFNDSNVFDQLLLIEIVTDHPDARPDSEGCSTFLSWEARNSKRRRGDAEKKQNEICHSFTTLDISNCAEEAILDYQQEMKLQMRIQGVGKIQEF